MSFDLPATVSEIMTKDVVSLDETDCLSNLLESMQALRPVLTVRRPTQRDEARLREPAAASAAG